MAKVRVNWGRLEPDCPVRLYDVYNTANQNLLVLAKDEATALSIACTANHIHGTSSIMASGYSRGVEEISSLSGELAPLVTPAIEQRWQGTVHVADGRLFIGDRAVQP